MRFVPLDFFCKIGFPSSLLLPDNGRVSLFRFFSLPWNELTSFFVYWMSIYIGVVLCNSGFGFLMVFSLLFRYFCVHPAGVFGIV